MGEGNQAMERLQGLPKRRFLRGVPKTKWEKGRTQVFTLFVDNLNPNVGNKEVKELFQRIGVVKDVFISRKKRPNN